MTRFHATPEIREAITKVYQTKTGNGEVRSLASRLNISRWKISRWAIQWGLIPKQKKEPDWSEKEIHMLRQNAHRSPETIQRKLKSSGFFRSVTGIVLKRKRMGFLRSLDGMSANSLSKCLGVDVHFVTKSIKGGRLKANRREMIRKKIQGGNYWYIKDKDIRNYILNYLNEIDIRKVDKYWFVDLISR